VVNHVCPDESYRKMRSLQNIEREIQTLNDRSENRLWDFLSEEERHGAPGNCASHRKDDAS